jgi:hypothetical protein
MKKHLIARLILIVRIKADKKEADDFLRNSNEYARVQSRLYQWHMRQTQQKIDVVAQKMVMTFVVRKALHKLTNFSCVIQTDLQTELVAQTEANQEHIQQSEELQAHHDNQQQRLKVRIRTNFISVQLYC